MAERNIKGEQMNLPHSSKLNIGYLSRIFDNKSECYKLFWFKAIMTQIAAGKSDISFEELIDEMIADAWYMVAEYHLNLGPNDTLEKVVNYMFAATGMLPATKKEKILEYLKTCTDRQVVEYKRTLTLNVPYRLQAPYFNDFKTADWDARPALLAQRINQQERLMYYFTTVCGLQSRIEIDPDWMEYLTENREIVNGWIQYNMITYLQRRNPSVPGIADKLEPPMERKLDKVKKYWKLLVSIEPVQDIYGHVEMTPKNISIDHFVPWSYVAHDEFWNLHPTTKPINSAKSNNLAEWGKYFGALTDLEYRSYELMWEYEELHKKFDSCASDHLNNGEIRERLYHQGLTKAEFAGQLQDVIHPVYAAAKNCGFKEWEY